MLVFLLLEVSGLEDCHIPTSLLLLCKDSRLGDHAKGPWLGLLTVGSLNVPFWSSTVWTRVEPGL